MRLLRCRGCNNVDALTRSRGGMIPRRKKRQRVRHPWDDLTSDEDDKRTPMKNAAADGKEARREKCVIDLTSE